jgi:hypothetical protein
MLILLMIRLLAHAAIRHDVTLMPCHAMMPLILRAIIATLFAITP